MPRHLQLSLATTALLIGASLAGCGAEPFTEPTLISEPPTLVAAVSVTPAADTLRALGEVRRLVATARDKTGAPILGGAFTWRSSDENVLSVSSDGQISAMGNGSAVVTAGTEGVAGSATILVRQEPAQLGFTMLPTSVEAGAVIVPGLEVEVRDALGTRVRGATTRVTLSLEVTQCLGTLLGNLAANAEDGIAHFPDLMIDRAGRGFVLGARASGLTLALSRSFDVRAAPDTPPLRICIVDPAGDQTGQIDVL
ncbi:MAG TPA: hypothetical protein VD793_10945, partial [Gemmatimonadales bacterium]|nr:hypothetical protein [Gemmatimonadales bacterium]